jgi:hypothetical protein
MQACEMALAMGRLEASPYDDGLTWLVTPDGSQSRLVWPPGFGIRFADRAEVIGPDGTIVAIAGRSVELTGGFSDGDAFYVCGVNGKMWLPG